MSYEPTQWKAGDTVTSAKLNKIEQGISSIKDILLVNGIINESTRQVTLNKTWQEIYDAKLAAVQLIENNYKGIFPITTISVKNNTYSVICTNQFTFSTSSPDDYPTVSLQIEDSHGNK